MEQTEKQKAEQLQKLKAKRAKAEKVVEYLQQQLTMTVARSDGLLDEIRELESEVDNG